MTRTGLPTPISAQTDLQDLLKPYQERIDTIGEVYLAQFYGRALQQGNQCASEVIDLANIHVTDFLAALQAQSLCDLDQKVKTGCNILGHETEDLFLARAIWEMAAKWLLSAYTISVLIYMLNVPDDIQSRLALYQRNDLCLSVDVDKSARMIHARLQRGLAQTYGAQSAFFQSVLDGVESCAGLSSTASQVGGGLGLAAGTVLFCPSAALLAIPLVGVAVWKPETMYSAHRWSNGIATSVGRQARSWTYAVGSSCGLLKRVILVSG